jgi:hypothetical protein
MARAEASLAEAEALQKKHSIEEAKRLLKLARAQQEGL